MSRVPAIRFKGFTDPWEQRKLGELVELTYGGGTPNTSNGEYWNGSIPWIQSSNVIEDELFHVDISKGITVKGLEESAALLVPKNSIAVVTHVGVGKLVYLPFSYATSQDFVSLSGLKGGCSVSLLFHLQEASIRIAYSSRFCDKRNYQRRTTWERNASSKFGRTASDRRSLPEARPPHHPSSA